MADVREFIESTVLEVGEKNLLEGLAKDVGQVADDDEVGIARLTKEMERVLADYRIRIGTLLRTDNVSVLLGAGASVYAGGPLLGSLPLALERALLTDGLVDGEPVEWLSLIYYAAKATSPDIVIPGTGEFEGRKHGDAVPLAVNVEQLLSVLTSWRAAMEGSFTRLTLENGTSVSVTKDVVEAAIHRLTDGLMRLCDLPADVDCPLEAHRNFLKRLLLRPLNLKRANLFTLNYDSLLEKAADAEGIVVVDGFVGVQKRTFRPESYDQDLYFPAETTEGRVSRLDRVLHLHKLHGSVSWQTETPSMSNPFGLRDVQGIAEQGRAVIFPTPSKYGDTLGMPYAELFRRFAKAVVRPQSVLVVLGYGFGDEHVNAIIRQALAVPSFTLVIVDPTPPKPDASGGFVARLRAQKDARVWVVGGWEAGTFEGFVRRLMPDLQDEDILARVMTTHRALTESKPEAIGGLDGE